MFQKITLGILPIITFFLFSCKHESEKSLSFIPTEYAVNSVYNYYKDAEKLTYSVKYGLIDAGDIIIESEDKTIKINETSYYHVTAKCHLKSAFFNINNYWDSFIDTNSLLPYKFSRAIQENKYRKYEYTFFKRQTKQAEVSDTTDKNTPQIKSFNITANIQDMISSFFLLRNLPFEDMIAGDTTTIDVFMENACYNVRSKFIGKEKLKTKQGKIETFVITPLIDNAGAALSGDTPIKVWLTNDKRRIPLKIQIKLVIGAVELSLKDYKKR